MPVSRDYGHSSAKTSGGGDGGDGGGGGGGKGNAIGIATAMTVVLIVENVALFYWLATIIWAASVHRSKDIVPILLYGIHLAAPVVTAGLFDSSESATASTRRALVLFLVLNGIFIGDVGSLIAWEFASATPLHNFVLALLIYAIVMDIIYYIFVIVISRDSSKRKSERRRNRTDYL
jgi:hypothetical protein